MEELQREVNRIGTVLLGTPLRRRALVLRREIARLSEPEKTLAMSLAAVVASSHNSMDWEKAAIFVFGISFFLILLCVAFLVPNPTVFQLWVFRVVLASAAAGVAALIPGFLNINSKVKEFSLRAGGALAVFVVIYLLNPPSLAKLVGH